LLKSNYLKNWGLLTLTEVIGQVLSLIIVLKITRILSIEDYGLYVFIISLANFWSVFSFLGMKNIIVRRIATLECSIGELLSSVLLLRILSSVFVFIILFLYIYFLTDKYSYQIIIYTSLLILLNNIFDILSSFALGKNEIKFIAFSNLIYYILWFTIIILLPRHLLNIELILTSNLVSLFIKSSIIFMLMYNKRFFDTINKFNLKKLLELLKESAPFLWISILTTFTTSLPVLFLENNSSVKEVGIYNIGNRFTVPLMLLIETAMTSFYPIANFLYSMQKNRFLKDIRKYFLLYIYLSIMFVLIMNIISKPLIIILFGYKYYVSASVFNCQLWVVFFHGLFHFIGVILVASKNDFLIAKQKSFFGLLTIPFSFGGAYYGARGLSIGLIVSSFLSLFYYLWSINKIESLIFIKNFQGLFLFYLCISILASLLYTYNVLNSLEFFFIILIILILPIFNKKLKIKETIFNSINLFLNLCVIRKN